MITPKLRRMRARNASAFFGLCGAVLMVALAAGCGSSGSGGVAPPPPSGSAKLYVASGFPGTVSAYSIDPSTGLLADLAGFPVPTVPPTIFSTPVSENVAVASTSSGAFAYISTSGSGLNQDPPGPSLSALSEFAIDAANGMFAALADSPLSPGFGCPADVIVDPTGSYLYSTDPCNGTILEYNIDPKTGDLIPMPASPTGELCTPVRMTEDPSGNFVYVADDCEGGIIREFAVDSTGATCGSPGCLVQIGSQNCRDTAGLPSSCTDYLAVPTGITSVAVGGSEFVYVTDKSNKIVAEYNIVDPATSGVTSGCGNGNTNTDPGCLNILGSTDGGSAAYLAGATDITVDPSAQFAYVADNYGPDFGGDFAEFSIVGTGTVGASCDNSGTDTDLGCLNAFGEAAVPNINTNNSALPLRVITTKTSSGGEYLYSSDDAQNTVLEYVINLNGSADCIANQLGTSSDAGCLSVNGPGALPLSGLLPPPQSGFFPRFATGGMAIAK